MTNSLLFIIALNYHPQHLNILWLEKLKRCNNKPLCSLDVFLTSCNFQTKLRKAKLLSLYMRHHLNRSATRSSTSRNIKGRTSPPQRPMLLFDYGTDGSTVITVLLSSNYKRRRPFPPPRPRKRYPHPFSSPTCPQQLHG